MPLAVLLYKTGSSLHCVCDVAFMVANNVLRIMLAGIVLCLTSQAFKKRIVIVFSIMLTAVRLG